MLGQLIGHDLPLVEKRRIVRSFFLLLAEREDATIVAKLFTQLPFQVHYFLSLQVDLRTIRALFQRCPLLGLNRSIVTVSPVNLPPPFDERLPEPCADGS
jgi:hypothetical protein